MEQVSAQNLSSRLAERLKSDEKQLTQLTKPLLEQHENNTKALLKKDLNLTRNAMDRQKAWMTEHQRETKKLLSNQRRLMRRAMWMLTLPVLLMVAILVAATGYLGSEIQKKYSTLQELSSIQLSRDMSQKSWTITLPSEALVQRMESGRIQIKME